MKKPDHLSRKFIALVIGASLITLVYFRKAELNMFGTYVWGIVVLFGGYMGINIVDKKMGGGMQ